MTMVIVALISLVFFAAIIAPFLGTGERLLLNASSRRSIEELRAEKTALVKRYVEDEQAYLKRSLNKFMWEQRRQYLVNRYLDASRRADFLLANEQEAEGKSDG